MLRLADAHRSYDLTVKVAGQDVKMTVRSMTLLERLEVVESLSKLTGAKQGFDDLCVALARFVVKIPDYPDKKPVDVFRLLEHRKDLEEICQGILEWSLLPEQESKNLSSSPEQSTPGSAGSAAKSAGVEKDPA